MVSCSLFSRVGPRLVLTVCLSLGALVMGCDPDDDEPTEDPGGEGDGDGAGDGDGDGDDAGDGDGDDAGDGDGVGDDAGADDDAGAGDGGLVIQAFDDHDAFVAAAGALTVVDFDEVDVEAADDPVVLALDAYAAQGLVFVGEPPLVHPEFNFPEDYPATSEPNVLAAGPAADLNAAEGAGGKTTTIEFRNGTVDALTAAFGAQFIDPDFPDYEISRLMAYDAEGELLATVEAIGGDAEAVFVGVVATRDGTPTSEIARIELITGSGYAGVSANEGVVLDDFEFAEPE